MSNNPQRIDNLESLAQSKVAGSLWSLATSSPLAAVLAPGWMTARFAAYGLRLHDRLVCTASLNDPTPEYATLVVTEVNRGEVVVAKVNGAL